MIAFAAMTPTKKISKYPSQLPPGVIPSNNLVLAVIPKIVKPSASKTPVKKLPNTLLRVLF